MKLLERNVTWWGLWHQEWGKAAGSVSPEWQSWKVIGELFGFVAYDYLEDLLNGFLPVFGSEWWSSGQHVIHQGPKWPPIDCLREEKKTNYFCDWRLSRTFPCPVLVSISGAMYSIVPQKVCVTCQNIITYSFFSDQSKVYRFWVQILLILIIITVCSSMDSLQRPKSVSFTWPVASRRMFSGFKSR